MTGQCLRHPGAHCFAFFVISVRICLEERMSVLFLSSKTIVTKLTIHSGPECLSQPYRRYTASYPAVQRAQQYYAELRAAAGRAYA